MFLMVNYNYVLILGVKDQLTKENEELKQRNGALDQQKDELDVRMTALKSQYEGRISRLERELREHQERHLEQRDEPQEPTNKVTSQFRLLDRPLCETVFGSAGCLGAFVRGNLD